MRRSTLLLVPMLLLGMVFVGTLSAPAADKADAAKLVAQLGSTDFEEREAAAAALEALGAPAVDALRQGLQSQDPEVAMRSGLLIKKLETRVAGGTLLAGKRVHLVYKNTPLIEAIADFNKQSGYTINLLDQQNTLKDRTVTLDTGDVTFWQALDGFCDAAGLAEMNTNQQMLGGFQVRPIMRRGPIQVAPPQPVPVPVERPKEQPKQVEKKQVTEPKPNAVEKKGEDKAARAVEVVPAVPLQPQAQPQNQIRAQVVQVQLQAQPAIARNPVMLQGAPAQGITLIDGKVATPPTDASGSIRIRAMDRNDLGMPANDKEILFGLQATPEPRLQCQFLPDVKILKAVDENGQNLTLATQAELENDAVPQNGPGFQPVPRLRGGRVMRALPMENVLTVRLKAGNQPSKTLKEVRGIVTAQVLGESQPIITVDEILKAAGKTFKGGDNGVVRIMELKKTDGQIEIRLEFEAPRDLVAAAAAPQDAIDQPAIPIQPGVRPRAIMKVQPINQAVPVQAVQPVQAVPPVQAFAPVPPLPAIPAASANHGFTLLDEKGESLPVLSVTSNNRTDVRGGVVTEHRMVFRTGKNEPARLVFAGKRNITLEVPFTLKDVNVP